MIKENCEKKQINLTAVALILQGHAKVNNNGYCVTGFHIFDWLFLC